MPRSISPFTYTSSAPRLSQHSQGSITEGRVVVSLFTFPSSSGTTSLLSLPWHSLQCSDVQRMRLYAMYEQVETDMIIKKISHPLTPSWTSISEIAFFVLSMESWRNLKKPASITGRIEASNARMKYLVILPTCEGCALAWAWVLPWRKRENNEEVKFNESVTNINRNDDDDPAFSLFHFLSVSRLGPGLWSCLF